MGSYGNENVSSDGQFLSYYPMFVKVGQIIVSEKFQTIDLQGTVKSVNWICQYAKLRRAFGIEFPGYMIHESAQFSQVQRRWFFMPKYASMQAFNAASVNMTGIFVFVFIFCLCCYLLFVQERTFFSRLVRILRTSK